MRFNLLYFLFPLIFWQTCILKKPGTEEKKILAEIPKDSISFINHVQPLLISKCSPCHFTGGKMYQKMPFDQDTTIINHEKGILKRFKDDENLLIRNFIEQSKK